MKTIVLILIITTSLFSCTKNSRAKEWGGTASIDLPRGEKLVMATWKDSDLWYLTRPMTPQDSAITYTFKEKSSFGIMQGTYIITESK